MGISNCPGELPWPGVTGTSRVLQNHPSITHGSCATKPSQQGLTLTPLCSWVPPHSDTQESKLQHSPVAPEQHFCAHSRTLAAANPGSRGHHAARQHQGLMGFGHSCWDGWMQHHPSGAQLHVPWACNEMKTPFGKKVEALQTIPSPECWSF